MSQIGKAMQHAKDKGIEFSPKIVKYMKSSIGQASLVKFKGRGQILIHSISRTDFVSIATEPFIWIDIATPFEEITRQVIRALDSSKSGLNAPKDWKKYLTDFLKSLGLKKESELYQDALYVGVLRKEGVITFTPMKNFGMKGGAVNVPDAAIDVSADQPLSEISIALQKAIEKSE
jgi:hypothetical protein